MTDLKFVDELPHATRGPGGFSSHLNKLRANPDQWAEIARYPKTRRGNAQSRGYQIARRYQDIQYAVRTDGDEVVLFVRAVPR